MSRVVKQAFALERGPFKTFDPFLFCVFHHDEYPKGEANMGPHPSALKGRDLGMDFSYENGWSMYHGAEVPGFPSHPHRGFETVTVGRQGLVDHADSMGCTARYGNGDTQWMTAGRGVQHSEMFPLLETTKPNVLDLFQIWLNLPKKSKMCEPAFEMFWAEETPFATLDDESGKGGKGARVKVVAGRLGDVTPLTPPPNSWASDPANHVAIWVLEVSRDNQVTIPAGPANVNRAIYFVRGNRIAVEGKEVPVMTGLEVKSDVPLTFSAIGADADVLLLQGRPIGEPVAQRGPMVMNTREEIFQAFADYQATGFGGWPWKEHDHVHPRDTPRHALRFGKQMFPPKK